MSFKRGIKYCQNCGTPHDLNFTNTCSVCGQPIRTEAQKNKAKAEAKKRSIQNRRAKNRVLLDELNELQKGLTPLTEAEWQKAVRHFGGCALCPTKEIEARIMLIPMKDGGKYNRGNVIPACADCANKYVIKNKLGKVDWVVTQDKRFESGIDKKAPQRLVDAINYLKEEAQHD